MVTWILIGILTGIVFAMIAEGMIRRGGIYEFPFLAAAISLAFVLPQLPGIARDPFLPAGGLDKTLVFICLCLAMIRFGWQPTTGQSARVWIYRERSLLTFATVLVCVGAFFFFRFSQLPLEVQTIGQISGAPVIYLFFSSLLSYGFAIALLCLFRRWSSWAMILTVICGVFYFHRIVIAGRRADTAEFILTIAIALWFCKGWVLPRAAVAAGIVCTMLLMTSVSQYRTLSLSQDGLSLQRLAEIDVMRGFEDLVQNGGQEMRNAVYAIHSIDKRMIFDFGSSHWNGLVLNFVPAQIVGQALKETLLLPLPDNYLDTDWIRGTGTTETGFVDAFASFWYFGALKFFLISYVLGWLYGLARNGSTEAQLVYILSAVPAMHSITHSTQLLFSVWFQLGIFIMLPLLFMRQPKDSIGGPARQEWRFSPELRR